MEFSTDELAARKKAIFDSMSARGQRAILKRGYDAWDPFQDPKDPIEIRRDPTQRTAQMLVQDFLESRPAKSRSSAYDRGVLEIAIGLINDDDRFRAMYEFGCWYQDQLRKDGAGR